MKPDIHPDYVVTKVTCSCGNTFETRSTKDTIRVEICNQCHPFYTGKQKLIDSGGRVERFQRKLARRPDVEEVGVDEAAVGIDQPCMGEIQRRDHSRVEDRQQQAGAPEQRNGVVRHFIWCGCCR